MATDWAPAPALENERSPETLERVPGKIVDAWTTDEGARGGAIAEAPRGGAKTEEAPQVNNERARWRAPPEREGPRDNKASSECNLCSSSAVEPVVTRCGHLYCWSCVYRRAPPPVAS
jgi:E3 ubiquitin-protein ligase RNF5